MKLSTAQVAALIFTCAMLVYTAGSSTLPLLGPDEPRYAEVAREMVNDRQYTIPLLGGFTWFEKPVLLYWMMAAGFKTIGAGELASRLPSAISAALSLLLLFHTVRRITSHAASVFVAVVTGTTLFFIGFSHAATFDMLLAFTVTAALCSYMTYLQSANRLDFYLIFFFLGAGVLAKGFVAFILIGLPIGVHLLISREWKVFFQWRLIPAVIVMLFVIAIWVLPVSMIYGARFWDEFVYQHHFMRYTSSQFHRASPVYYYLPVLLLGTFPWTPLLFWRVKAEESERKVRSFAWIWFLSIVLFFSFSRSKLPGYILPAIPAFGILAGLNAAGLFRLRSLDSAATAKPALILALFNAAIIAGIVAVSLRMDIRGGLTLAAVMAIMLIASVLFYYKDNITTSFGAFAAAPVMGSFLVAFYVLPLMNIHDFKQLSLQLKREFPTVPVAVYNVYDYSTAFYTKGSLLLNPQGYLYNVNDYRHVHRILKRRGTAAFVVGNEELEWMSQAKYWNVLKILKGAEHSIIVLQSK